MDEELEKAIAEFNTLQKIVEQLESDNIELGGGPLINNAAFLALKQKADEGYIFTKPIKMKK